MPSDTTPHDPLLTVKQLAEREGVSEEMVRHFYAKKGLPHYKACGIRIRYSDYLSWLESSKVVNQ